MLILIYSEIAVKNSPSRKGIVTTGSIIIILAAINLSRPVLRFFITAKERFNINSTLLSVFPAIIKGTAAIPDANHIHTKTEITVSVHK